MEAKYFNLNELFEIIKYLVNKIEEKDYSIAKYNIIIKGYKITKVSGISKNKVPYNGTIICLVDSENKERLNKYFSSNEFEQNELNKTSNEYIQLTYYRSTISNRISMKNDFIPITNMKNDIEFKINNNSYSYILDFVNKLYEYKLDKEDVSISYGEMKLLADEFINEYKDIKKLVKM